jgi:hypothetical protein
MAGQLLQLQVTVHDSMLVGNECTVPQGHVTSQNMSNTWPHLPHTLSCWWYMHASTLLDCCALTPQDI